MSTTNPQDVFVTNDGMSTIDEYTHSGVYVTHLSDAGWIPISCAYLQTSPTTALLAVGNYTTTMAGPGSVSVYAETAGVWSGPTIYTPPGSPLVYFMDYKGNTLFLDLYVAGSFELMRMSSNGSFTSIPLVGLPCAINEPAGVQDIGNYLAIGDQSPNAGCPNIYHVRPSGAVIGSTTLSPSPFDLVQFFRKGSRIVAADFNPAGASADIYSYPNGALITPISAPLVQPAGSAVSHQ